MQHIISDMLHIIYLIYNTRVRFRHESEVISSDYKHAWTVWVGKIVYYIIEVFTQTILYEPYSSKSKLNSVKTILDRHVTKITCKNVWKQPFLLEEILAWTVDSGRDPPFLWECKSPVLVWVRLNIPKDKLTSKSNSI